MELATCTCRSRFRIFVGWKMEGKEDDDDDDDDALWVLAVGNV